MHNIYRDAVAEAAKTHTCSGTASSAAMKPAVPLKKLFVATAVEDLPVFASTIYASVLEYIHLEYQLR